MSFDWLTFLSQNRIEYSETGPNTSKGNIVIHCPFCGTGDPGMHLSVSTRGRGWRCFRNPVEHRGASPIRLVAALLNVPFHVAARMTGGDRLMPDDFMSRMSELLRKREEREEPERTLELPHEFKRFGGMPSARPFIKYMEDKRGIDHRDVHRLADQFNLRYCTSGRFHHRVIFPVYFHDELVTWTGRHIGSSNLRYMTLATEPPEDDPRSKEPLAIGPITDYLLFYDDCLHAAEQGRAHTICIVEGPMDALKVWYLGQHHGIVATSLFTSSASDAQIDLLYQLLDRFKRKYILLDRDTLRLAMMMQGTLSVLGVQALSLTGFKDPGEMRQWRDLRGVLPHA